MIKSVSYEKNLEPEKKEAHAHARFFTENEDSHWAGGY